MMIWRKEDFHEIDLTYFIELHKSEQSLIFVVNEKTIW